MKVKKLFKILTFLFHSKSILGSTVTRMLSVKEDFGGNSVDIMISLREVKSYFKKDINFIPEKYRQLFLKIFRNLGRDAFDSQIVLNSLYWEDTFDKVIEFLISDELLLRQLIRSLNRSINLLTIDMMVQDRNQCKGFDNFISCFLFTGEEELLAGKNPFRLAIWGEIKWGETKRFLKINNPLSIQLNSAFTDEFLAKAPQSTLIRNLPHFIKCINDNSGGAEVLMINSEKLMNYIFILLFRNLEDFELLSDESLFGNTKCLNNLLNIVHRYFTNNRKGESTLHAPNFKSLIGNVDDLYSWLEDLDYNDQFEVSKLVLTVRFSRLTNINIRLGLNEYWEEIYSRIGASQLSQIFLKSNFHYYFTEMLILELNENYCLKFKDLLPTILKLAYEQNPNRTMDILFPNEMISSQRDFYKSLFETYGVEIDDPLSK